MMLYTNGMKTFFSLLCISLSLALIAGSPSFAKPGTTTNKGKPGSAVSSIGNDISYPQCGSTLPSGQAFGIVGVNGGIATTTNPCLLQQLAWASTSNGSTPQPAVSLYVNTANPGHIADLWPSNNTVYGSAVFNPYGECDSSEGAACAYIYGWTRADDDANRRGISNPEQYKWWLDVETANSWSTSDLQANAASLEGMVGYFNSIGASVGIYSTAYQWQTIVGTLWDGSNLHGLDSWLAGARTERGARANCASPALTNGGRVTLAQYVSKGFDYDVSCL